MSRWLCLAFLIACSSVPVIGASAEKDSTTLYVQLVLATNEERPRAADWKPIGPKLSKRISPVFRWKNYWEVARHTVAAEKGKATRVRLSDERELEIEPMEDGRLETRLHRGGKLVRKATHLSHQKMIIMGGDANGNDAWFVVVRREMPQ
jgi:hypothetical protein